MDPSPFWIALAGLLIPMVIVPVALGMKHARFDRQLEHTERMKALELGRKLPGDEAWWSPALIGLAFGVLVPIGVFAFAFLAVQADPQRSVDAWAAATIVAIAGVFSGARIVRRHFELEASRTYRQDDAAQAKSAFDADTFDVVGTRG